MYFIDGILKKVFCFYQKNSILYFPFNQPDFQDKTFLYYLAKLTPPKKIQHI